LITIFSTPKSFEGHIGIIQRNAIISWLKLKNHPEIILFGNESGTEEICKEFNLKFIPDVEVNEFGTPLCRDMFKRAQEESKYDYMALVNADIILTNSFIENASCCSGFKKFLVIGQRYDLKVTKLINFNNNQWEDVLKWRVMHNGTLHKVTGIDYFIFRKFEWMNLPPFAIGRPAWDNWLVFQAIEKGHKVIDATEVIFVVHQNHEHPKGVTVWEKGIEKWSGQESASNRILADKDSKIHSGFITNAPWIMKENGVIECR